MILGFMNANAQSPEKVEQLKDTVSNFADEKLLNDLRIATGIEWKDLGPDSAGAIFDFSPDEKKEVREIPKLNLGAYGGDLQVAKVIRQNHTKDGRIKYTVDISDKRYMDTSIFKRIKEYNSELKDVIIQFTIKGSPLPTKDIKL